jgi:PAP2 superfamily
MTTPRGARGMRRAPRSTGAWLLVSLLLVAGPPPAIADPVTDWNLTTFAVETPANILRTLAMVHLAMFDAVNAVSPEYQAYAVSGPVAGDVSAEAAAAGAAYGILIRLLPAQQALLDAALAASLASIPDDPAKTAGLALGDAVADMIVALRSGDGILTPGPPYTPGTEPGDYQLTPPNFPAPVATGAKDWTPFAMTSASQFRPNGPPALHTGRYAREVAEVRRVGTDDPLLRTPEQDLIANWHREQAHFQVNRIAREAVAGGTFDLLTSARMFALLNVATMDGVLSVFEAKYVYDFWRPITAIREAGDDGNPATAPDPDWAPFLGVTPPHPEYPSAHAVGQAAAATVLEAFLGHHYGFTATSATVPGVERSFDSLAAFVEDGKLGRVYGGIHFRSAVDEGARQGKKLGKWVLRTLLEPLHGAR